MNKIIDGKQWSNTIKAELKNEVDSYLAKGYRQPMMVVVQVGEDPASSIYVRNKQRACEAVGIKSLTYNLPLTISQEELLTKITNLNQDPEVDAILCQLPLPRHIDTNQIINAIDPRKDVDGFHPLNQGLMFTGTKSGKESLRGFLPCTPQGIMTLLDREKISVDGKVAVVIGRSNILGKPVAQLLLQKNATVISCHSHTQNLADFIKMADIVIAAIGKANFIKTAWLKAGAVVIDAGINRLDDGKITGDVETTAIDVVSKITPVPGGVGPMTVVTLMKNTVDAYRQNITTAIL